MTNHFGGLFIKILKKKSPCRDFQHPPNLMSGMRSDRESPYQIWEICLNSGPLPLCSKDTKVTPYR